MTRTVAALRAAATGDRRISKMQTRREREEEAKRPALQIAINEMIPADRRCDDAITKMKAKLARLQQGPALKLVTDN
jgi:hypothetical protein